MWLQETLHHTESQGKDDHNPAPAQRPDDDILSKHINNRIKREKENFVIRDILVCGFLKLFKAGCLDFQ